MSNQELQQIELEYGTWFNKFVLQNGIIILETIEKDEYKLEFTSGGWIFNDDEIYETFESGMMNKSDDFKKRFHEKLIEKLNSIK